MTTATATAAAADTFPTIDLDAGVTTSPRKPKLPELGSGPTESKPDLFHRLTEAAAGIACIPAQKSSPTPTPKPKAKPVPRQPRPDSARKKAKQVFERMTEGFE